MAYSFNGSTDYFRLGTPVITAEPFCIFMWFKPVSASVFQGLIEIGTNGNFNFFRLIMNASGQGQCSARGAAGSPVNALTTNTATAGAWNSILGRYIADNNRRVIVNGDTANLGSETTSVVAAPTDTQIAAIGPASDNLNGELAELAVWDSALSDETATILHKGMSPEFIAPANLVFYWDAIRGTTVNRGNFTLTAGGTPSVAAHAPIWYRPKSVYIPVPAAAGATGTATQTLPSVTQAGTGEQPYEGTAAQTLGALTQSASGEQPHIGTAAQTLGAFTQTATGQAPTEGTGAQILGPVTQAGAGVEHPTGTSAQALPSATQAASGTTAAGATGTATQTLPATTQAGVGETPHEGTGTQTAPALQQSGVGVQTIPGTAAQTIAALTQAGVGIQVFTGTATQALPSLTQAGAGLQTVPGTAAQIIAALTQSGVGIELPSGTAAQTLPAVTMGAVGIGPTKIVTTYQIVEARAITRLVEARAINRFVNGARG